MTSVPLRYARWSPDRIPGHEEESDQPPWGPVIVQSTSYSRVTAAPHVMEALGLVPERWVVYWSRPAEIPESDRAIISARCLLETGEVLAW